MPADSANDQSSLVCLNRDFAEDLLKNHNKPSTYIYRVTIQANISDVRLSEINYLWHIMGAFVSSRPNLNKITLAP